MQSCLFDAKALCGTLTGGGVDAQIGCLVSPRGGLGAEVCQSREGASVEG